MPHESIKVRAVGLSPSAAVSALRAMRDGEDPRTVAARYGISQTTAYVLRSGASWRGRAAHQQLAAEVAARHAEKKDAKP